MNPAKYHYTQFSEQFIHSLIGQYYDLEDIQCCDFYYRGVNDTYRIKTINRYYAFRIYCSGWRSLTQVEFEIALLNQLEQHACMVSVPVANKSGAYVFTLDAPEGQRFCVLFDWIGGQNPDYANMQHAATFGKSAAVLHQSLDRFKFRPPGPELDLDCLLNKPLSLLLSEKLITKLDRDGLIKIADSLSSAFSDDVIKSLDWGLCHGDLHGGNANIQADQLSIFDFDFCSFGWRLYDLATYCWAGLWRGQLEANRQAFLNSYLTTNHQSEQQIFLLKEFILLRQIWFLGYEISRKNIVGIGYFSPGFFSHHLVFLNRINQLNF